LPTLRTFALRGLLLVSSLALGLVAAEGIAALLWEAPWYDRLVAEQQQSELLPYARNQLALRGPEVGPKPEGVRRVLALGDSFTFGLGVEDDDAPFPAVLNDLLADTGSVEVINGGIPGSVTGDWVALWKRSADAIDPDVVVAVFFLRDGTMLATIPAFFDRIRTEFAERNRKSRLYQLSHLYRRYRDLRDRELLGEIYTQELIEAYLGKEKREWRKARRNLIALRDLAEARGASFGLAIFPVLVELDEDYPFQAVTDVITEFANENDIPVHDLLPGFRGHAGPDLWVSSFDQHPNAEGHALAARALEPFVRQLLDAPETASR